MKPTICTYSGIEMAPMTPTIQMIDYRDVAHALALMPRFTGHTCHFFSVAQHSVGVSFACDEQDAAYGLLHDAAEAYLVDVPSPIKQLFPEYAAAEDRLLAVLYEAFGLDPLIKKPDSVKRADKQALVSERFHLMPNCTWWPKTEAPPYQFDARYFLDAVGAKKAFLSRLNYLHRLGLIPKLPRNGLLEAA